MEPFEQGDNVVFDIWDHQQFGVYAFIKSFYVFPADTFGLPLS
jgi:hypothetical protein